MSFQNWDLFSIDFSFEFDLFLKLKIINHDPPSSFKQRITSLLEPVFVILAIQNFPKMMPSDVYSQIEAFKSKLIKIHRTLFLTLSTAKHKDFLLNALLFVSIVFSFEILIKHFQAKVTRKMLVSGCMQIFSDIYQISLSSSFVEKGLSHIFVPDFFKRLLFIRKPSLLLPKKKTESEEEHSCLDFSVKNRVNLEKLRENSSFQDFKADIGTILQKRQVSYGKIKESPERFAENQEKEQVFSPRLKRIDWNSEGFKVFSRSSDENRGKGANKQKNDVRNDILKIDTREMRLFRSGSIKKTRNDKIRKKSPEEIMKDLRDLKEVLTKVHGDLKRTYFKPEKIEQNNKNSEEMSNSKENSNEKSNENFSREKSNDEKSNEKSQILKFPVFSLTETRKKITIKIEEKAKKIEVQEENHGYLEEMTKIITERNKDELIRFKTRGKRNFVNRYKKILTEGSSSPDDRIKELEYKILEKKEDLKIFLKMSDKKIRKCENEKI